jgi:hypothetical protein
VQRINSEDHIPMEFLGDGSEPNHGEVQDLEGFQHAGDTEGPQSSFGIVTCSLKISDWLNIGDYQG